MRSKVWMVILVTMVVGVALAIPAAAAKLKINIGSTYGPDAPAHFGQVKFKELVEQRSKGEMEVLIHVGGVMGYLGNDSKVTRETRDSVEENQSWCWNPSITGTKTEDGFIATKKGPIMITKPVIYPRIEYQKNGVHLVRPGLMVLD